MNPSNSRQRRGSQSRDTSNPPKTRRVTNVYGRRDEISNDDPPSVRPEGYKSPYQLTKEGDRIELWWEGDDTFYRGTVQTTRSDGKHRVKYDDRQAMYHLLSREVYIFTGSALERFLAGCFVADARRHTNMKKPVHYPRLVEFLEVGHRIRVYWRFMKKWYRGLVTAQDTDGRFFVTFDDGDENWLQMKDVTFRFVEESAAVVHTRLMEECLGE